MLFSQWLLNHKYLIEISILFMLDFLSQGKFNSFNSVCY